MFKVISALSGLALLSACASQPEDIQASYVSPSIYANYTCPELFSERERLVARVNFVADAQADKATSDAVATGVGIVLFWPALFLLAAGSDREAELASLKGNYDAVEQSITQRKCQLESPSGATSEVAAAPAGSTTDASFEAQQRSINGETAATPAAAAPAEEPQPVAVAAAPAEPAAQPAPAASQPAPAPQAAPEPAPQAIAAAPATPAPAKPAPVKPAPAKPVAAPKPAPQPPAEPVVVAAKPTPVAAAAASPSIPEALYDDPNLAKTVDYSRAEIREYCGQAWRIRDLTDGTFEINPCYDRRYN